MLTLATAGRWPSRLRQLPYMQKMRRFKSCPPHRRVGVTVISPGPQPGDCRFKSGTRRPWPHRPLAKIRPLQGREDGSEPSGATNQSRVFLADTRRARRVRPRPVLPVHRPQTGHLPTRRPPEPVQRQPMAPARPRTRRITRPSAPSDNWSWNWLTIPGIVSTRAWVRGRARARRPGTDDRRRRFASSS
jgi:hypothetical protein